MSKQNLDHAQAYGLSDTEARDLVERLENHPWIQAIRDADTRQLAILVAVAAQILLELDLMAAFESEEAFHGGTRIDMLRSSKKQLDHILEVRDTELDALMRDSTRRAYAEYIDTCNQIHRAVVKARTGHAARRSLRAPEVSGTTSSPSEGWRPRGLGVII